MIKIAGSIFRFIAPPGKFIRALDRLAMQICITLARTDFKYFTPRIFEVVQHFCGSVLFTIIYENGLPDHPPCRIPPLGSHDHGRPVKIYLIGIERYLLIVCLGTIVEKHLLSRDVIYYGVFCLIGDLVFYLTFIILITERNRINMFDRVNFYYRVLAISFSDCICPHPSLDPGGIIFYDNSTFIFEIEGVCLRIYYLVSDRVTGYYFKRSSSGRVLLRKGKIAVKQKNRAENQTLYERLTVPNGIYVAWFKNFFPYFAL